jgi:hypothetical protein
MSLETAAICHVINSHEVTQAYAQYIQRYQDLLDKAAAHTTSDEILEQLAFYYDTDSEIERIEAITLAIQILT